MRSGQVTDNGEYTINPHCHVKIWLSKDKDVFLNPENQLRLVQMRARNPNDTIHLVYSKELLSTTALAALEKFCDQHQIIPISVEEDIKQKLRDDDDGVEKKLMSLAILEMRSTIQNEGGNLAAASDILRLISPVFNLGIYADFDTEINTTGLPNKLVVAAPILLNLGSAKLFPTEMIRATKEIGLDQTLINYETLMVNNDIMAFPVPTTPEADLKQKESLHLLQKTICENYSQTNKNIDNHITTNETAIRTIFTNSTLRDSLLTAYQSMEKSALLMANKYGSNPIEMRKKIEEYHLNVITFSIHETKRIIALIPQEEHKQAVANILDTAIATQQFGDLLDLLANILRNALTPMVNLQQSEGGDIMIASLRAIYNIQDSEKFIQAYSEMNFRGLYRTTVMNITGPLVYVPLFESLYHSPEWVDTQATLFSWTHYDLDKHFKSRNNVAFHSTLETMAKKLTCTVSNDASWLVEGRKVIVKREENLHIQATKIQRLFKNHKAKNKESTKTEPADTTTPKPKT